MGITMYKLTMKQAILTRVEGSVMNARAIQVRLTGIFRRFQRSFFSAVAVVVVAAPTTAFGWNYSNVPLFWHSGIKPNVTLMIDDSGSMQALVVNESFQRALENNTLSTQNWYWCTGTYNPVTGRCSTKNSTAINNGFAVRVWTPPSVANFTFPISRSWYTGITSPVSCGSTSSGFFKSGTGTTSTTSYTAAGICQNNHGMANGTLVEYVSPATGGAATLSTAQTYYVVNASTHGFQLSTAFNGAPISFNITLGSSGSFTFRRYRPSSMPTYIGGEDVALCDVSKVPNTAGYYIGRNGLATQEWLSAKTLPTSDQVGVLISNNTTSNGGTRDSCVRWKLASTARSTVATNPDGRDYSRYDDGTLYYTPGTSGTDAYGMHLVNTLLPATGSHSINFDNSTTYPNTDSDPTVWNPASDNLVIPNVTRMQAAREVAQNVVLDFYDKMNIGLYSFPAQQNTAVPDGTNPTASRLTLVGANMSTLASDMPAAALDGSIGALNAENSTPLANTQNAINTYFWGGSSPIRYRCQKNYSVIMTDGDPTSDSDTLDNRAQQAFDTDAKTTGTDLDGVSWNDATDSNKWYRQNIITYTLGFGLENNLLKRTPLVNEATRVPGYPAELYAVEINKSSINPTTDIITLDQHGLQTGDYIRIASQTGAASGLTTGNFYYVAVLSGNQFRIAGASSTGDTTATTADNSIKATQCAATAVVSASGPCLPLTGGTGILRIATGPGKSFFSVTPEQLALDLGSVFNQINNLTASASAVSTNAKNISSSLLVYQARFSTEDWSGEVAAYQIQYDVNGKPYVDTSDAATPYWTTKNTLNSPAQRAANAFTWNGSNAVTFNYSNLTAAQQAAVGGAAVGPNVVNWLKGQTVSGFRDHSPNGLLGDILNSDPMFVQSLNFGYKNLPPSSSPCTIASDYMSASGSGCTGAEIYKNFVDLNKTREPILYVGANDGMLHAFNASTGIERMIFVPNAVYQDWNDVNNDGVNNDGALNIENKLQSLTSPAYDHRFFVDGNITIADAFLSGSWKTYLLGALGRGGRSVFAIDVTDTTYTTGDIKWEFTHPQLGYTYGKPLLARFANGNWYAIFPNGLDSQGDVARVFVVNIANSADFHVMSVNEGTPNPNGMMSLQVKLDSYRTVTDIYAADMRGNIWKFDMYNEGSGSVLWPTLGTRLFTARDPGNMVQSITGGLRLGNHPDGLGTMVFFGTGKYFETQDNVFSTVTSVPQIDTFYAVLDDGTINLTRTNLQMQQFFMSGTDMRTASTTAVNYTGGRKGWYIDLLDGTAKRGERVVSTPLLYGGRIIFVSIKPLSGGTCGGEGSSWLNELDALTGGQLPDPVLDTNADGVIDASDTPIASLALEGLGSEPSVVEGQDSDVKIIGTTSTSQSVQLLIESRPPEGALPGGKGRMSWHQLQ